LGWDIEDEAMFNQTKTLAEGPTTNGGAYAIAYWQDRNGNPTTKDLALKVKVVEFDANDRAICVTCADADGYVN
jgi:hypothetical protein